MTSRIATYATIAVLGAGTSGAIALAGHGSHAGPTGGAASGEYWPGKGCGDQNHERLPPTDNQCPQPNPGSKGTVHGKNH